MCLFSGHAGDGLSDRLAVKSMPSDWAYHKDEGLLQTAKREIHLLTTMVGLASFWCFFIEIFSFRSLLLYDCFKDNIWKKPKCLHVF